MPLDYSSIRPEEAKKSLTDLPLEILFEITSYLGLSDLGRLQQTNTKFYNQILLDNFYIYYNTVKFFELYYRKRLFAIFLFPHIHPRCTYTPSDRLQERWQRAHLLHQQHNIDCICDLDGFNGNTVFHVAASNGILDAVRFYLSRERRRSNTGNATMTMTHGRSRFLSNIDPNRSRFNQEAIEVISIRDHNRHCKLVDLLNEEPNTPLHYISVIPDGVEEASVLAVSRLLIRNGAKIDQRGRAGNNVLAEAAQHGQIAMSRLLLDEYREQMGEQGVRALISAQNEYEENAVILSARGHPEVLRLLLQNGGNPNSTRRGYALMHIVCSRFNLDRHDPSTLRNYHAQMTSPVSWGTPTPRFTDSPARVREMDGGMWPTAHTFRKHDEILELLIDYGANMSIVEASTGMKPMHTAAFWGDQTAIQILYEHGVDPNKELNLRNGWLPVHYACSEGQVFAVQTLISCKAQVWDETDVDYSLSIDKGTGLLLPPVPKYPFEIDISQLPEGLHVPAPLELMSFEAMKVKIKSFSTETSNVIEQVGR